MARFGPDSSLAGRTLQQLRQLARSLRIAGYSRLNGSALKQAVGLMSTRDEATPLELLQSDAPDIRGDASPLQAGPSVDAHSTDAPSTGGETSDSRSAVGHQHDGSGSGSSVTFIPRDPQWAYAFWQISAQDRCRAEAAGADLLCLRLADVTGLPPGSVHPHTLQEVVVDASGCEWFLPVPVCDRDYRVELGYRLPGGGWFPLALSSVARIPADGPSTAVADVYVPFSLEGPLAEVLHQQPADAVKHEHHYQRAMGGSVRRVGGGSELLQDLGGESTGMHSINDSGVGIWASGRTESGSGLQRQRSFWLVADAELIVYGATDPAATLFIGDQQVPLEADGSFRVHVHFPDGEQHYPIRAIAADGEQERSVRMQFQRSTPIARVNSRSAAVMEWF